MSSPKSLGYTRFVLNVEILEDSFTLNKLQHHHKESTEKTVAQQYSFFSSTNPKSKHRLFSSILCFLHQVPECKHKISAFPDPSKKESRPFVSLLSEVQCCTYHSIDQGRSTSMSLVKSLPLYTVQIPMFP